MSHATHTQVFCVLGSNVGRRARMMRRALLLLSVHPQITVIRASSVYETVPWGRENLDPYCNAVCEIQTTLSPLDLLDAFQAIERKLGRPKEHGLWEPRVIDLDIALYGNQIISEERLIVPHRFLNQRAFAMVPLLDLEPELVEPKSGKSYKQYLAELGDDVEHIAVQREALIAVIDGAIVAIQKDGEALVRSQDQQQTEDFGSAFAA